MRKMKSLFGFAAAITLLAAVAMGQGNFRADGTIQRIASDRILVRTAAQDIEVVRDAKTKITGELRRGAPATVFYTKVAGQDTATQIVMGGAPKSK